MCGSEGRPCQCNTAGVKQCSECGCNGAPWYWGLSIPERGGITDALADYYDDNSLFPAEKSRIISTISNNLSPDDSSWLTKNLPDKRYSDPGEMILALLPPIAWEGGNSDLIWKYPSDSVSLGQKLLVGENQAMVSLSMDGKACDSYSTGSYVLSSTNAPIWSSKSRKSLLGPDKTVLNGTPVFVSTGKEFEIDLNVSGQSSALRRIMAQGTSRVKVRSPGEFVEFLSSNRAFNNASAVQAVNKYSTDLLKKEMSLHELAELKGDSSILGKVLDTGFPKIGLYPIKIEFTYVGELGPGMFMQPGAQTSDPQSQAQRAEQMRKMAESMMSMQAAKMAQIQQMQQMRANMPQAQTLLCPSCHTPNPAASKFCNNCGGPLGKKSCPKCGKEAAPGIKFCGNCGTAL